jgi:hypothetical protein
MIERVLRMVPFRVFDRDKKEMWIVLNFQPAGEGGHYLVAKEDDSEDDGIMKLIPAKDFVKFRLVDFLDEPDDFRD